MANNRELELKVQALTQRLSEVVAEYENKIADLRVVITMAVEDQETVDAEVVDGD